MKYRNLTYPNIIIVLFLSLLLGGHVLFADDTRFLFPSQYSDSVMQSTNVKNKIAYIQEMGDYPAKLVRTGDSLFDVIKNYLSNNPHLTIDALLKQFHISPHKLGLIKTVPLNRVGLYKGMICYNFSEFTSQNKRYWFRNLSQVKDYLTDITYTFYIARSSGDGIEVHLNKKGAIIAYSNISKQSLPNSLGNKHYSMLMFDSAFGGTSFVMTEKNALISFPINCTTAYNVPLLEFFNNELLKSYTRGINPTFIKLPRLSVAAPKQTIRTHKYGNIYEYNKLSLLDTLSYSSRQEKLPALIFYSDQPYIASPIRGNPFFSSEKTYINPHNLFDKFSQVFGKERYRELCVQKEELLIWMYYIYPYSVSTILFIGIKPNSSITHEELSKLLKKFRNVNPNLIDNNSLNVYSMNIDFSQFPEALDED